MSSPRPFDEPQNEGLAESFSASDSPVMLLKDDAPGMRLVSKEAGTPIAPGTLGAAPERPTNAPEDAAALRNVLSAYAACGALWLVFASAVGLLVSLKLSYPELGTVPALSFGRLRPIHTNAAFFAWAAPALIGLALYVGARTSGTGLFSTRAAWLGLVLLNLAAVSGTVALDLGINNGAQEYREWPIWTQLVLVAALLVSAWNLIATLAHREEKRVYLSNRYTIGGLLWMVVVAVVSILPWYQRGLGQVSVQGISCTTRWGCSSRRFLWECCTTRSPRCSGVRSTHMPSAYSPFGPTSFSIPSSAPITSSSVPSPGGCRRPRSCSAWRCPSRCGLGAPTSFSACAARASGCIVQTVFILIGVPGYLSL